MGRILNRFSRMGVRTRLFVLVGVFFTGLIFLGVITGFIFRASQAMTILVNQERIFAENFQAAIEHFYKYEISEDENEIVLAKEHLNKSIAISGEFSKIDFTVKEMPETEWMPYLYDIFKEGVDYDRDKVKLLANQMSLFATIKPEMVKDIQKVAFDASELGKEVYTNMEDYSVNKTPEKLKELQAQFDSIHNYTETFSAKLYQFSSYLVKNLNLIIILITIALVVIVVLISVRISDSIKRPVVKLVARIKEMAKGDLKASLNLDSTNEVSELSKAFNEIQAGLLNVVSHAKKVAGGDYSSRLQPVSDKDELSAALNQMTAALEASKTHLEKENWLQKGLNGLDDQIRGNHSVSDLSERIIIYLCRFLGAEIGAIYIYNESSNQFELKGSVGANTNEVEKIIKPGEGLIGKVVKSGEFEVLDTKDKYKKVYSATGEINPEKLYLCPLKFDDKIQAVIELAAINGFSEMKLSYLQLIKERVSININAAIARDSNRELLDKSLEQAEGLKARDEQLVQKLEENQRIRENLTYQTTLLNSMMRTLPDNVYFKDRECRFVGVSESMAKGFNVKSSQDVIGKTDYDFHSRKDAMKFYEEEQEIIKTGKGFVDSVQRFVNENGEELWKSVTKLPMFDENGNCTGTFGISKNITDIKKLEQEVKLRNDSLVENQEKLMQTIKEMDKMQLQLKREKDLMDSLLDNLPDGVYFKDIESKFIKVSKSMAGLFNLEKPEDLYGKSDFDFFGDEHAGKAYEDEQRIIKSKVPIIGKIETETFKDGSIRYVSSTKMPLLNELGEAIGTFGISRDITQIKKLEIEVKERNEKLKEQTEKLELSNERLNQQQEELKATNEELHAQEEELRVANEELAEQTKILVESEKNLQVQQEELQVINEELETKTNILDATEGRNSEEQ